MLRMKVIEFPDEIFEHIDPIMQVFDQVSRRSGFDGLELTALVSAMFMQFGQISDKRMLEILATSVQVRRAWIADTLNDNE